MIKHIVLWRLNGADAETRAAQAKSIKIALEALNGHIPGLHSLQVGIDFSHSPQSAQLALISELDSREALAAYQVHPQHVAVKALVAAATSERYVVDYEA